MKDTFKNIQLGGQPEDVRQAIAAWNLMGSTLDWAALPIVMAILGIEDVETLVRQLNAMRLKVAADAEAARA